MFDRPRVIPCLLIENGGLVKTKQFKNPEYLGDPINAVKIYNEKMVDELCILDITKDKSAIEFELLSDIASEAFMPLSYGGGIKSLEQAKKLYKIGYEKILFNRNIIENPVLISEVVQFAGSQSVIASVDVKKSLTGYTCYTHNGKQKTTLSPVETAKRAEELGVGEILLNSIDRDGMMKGYDLNLIRMISSEISIPLIVCGGAGKISDFKYAIDAGADALGAGSLFVYYGKKRAVLINYPSEMDLIGADVYKK